MHSCAGHPGLLLRAGSRARADGLAGQVLRFTLVGGVTTVVYLALYALLDDLLGRQLANLLALLLTADANSLANRRLTFPTADAHGAGSRVRGSLTYLVSFLLTAGTLALLEGAGVESGAAYLVGLAAANLLSGVVHFVLLRWWAFASPGRAGDGRPRRG